MKIFLVSGSRAEYGSQRKILKLISEDTFFRMSLVVTGAHLSENHGNTINEIEFDGIEVSYKVGLRLIADDRIDTAFAVSDAINGFANVFAQSEPEFLLLVGDRYETFAAATAAHLLGIPIGHVHGGEITEGAFDDSLRHSITKMAHVHFVANTEFRNRVIQLGEQPKNVHIVGGLGIDAIASTERLNKLELEARLGMKFSQRNFLITFHPTTLDSVSSEEQIRNLLVALDAFPDTNMIFTMPNSDPANSIIRTQIISYAERHTSVKIFESLGNVAYLSTIPFVDCVIGNSSSGLSEVPSFGVPTVNIGIRQKGRPCASSVISTGSSAGEIVKGIQLAISPDFKLISKNAINPFGVAGASRKIVQIIKDTDISNLQRKSFYDLKSHSIVEPSETES